MIKDIKQLLKAPFAHWIFNPKAIIEIINESRKKTVKSATIKLDVYKQYYN